jgi:hypothetical protein
VSSAVSQQGERCSCTVWPSQTRLGFHLILFGRSWSCNGSDLMVQITPPQISFSINYYLFLKVQKIIKK